MQNMVTGNGSGQNGTVSDARWSSVLNTAVDGIIVIDESGRVLI
ncbi:MAG TPA: hypothetical protein VLQ65_14565 [Saliniramus sp.]|nr:hypothetical protein [Saliniramus sp.]